MTYNVFSGTLNLTQSINPENSQVFRPCLKEPKSCCVRRSSGKEFQTIGPCTANARRPTVESWCHVLCVVVVNETDSQEDTSPVTFYMSSRMLNSTYLLTTDCMTSWNSTVSFVPHIVPFSSDRQHLSCNGCLEVRGEIIRTVLCCIVYWSCAQSWAHLDEQFLQFSGLGFVSLGPFHCA